MLPTGHLLAFALLSFVLIIVPGPNVIFVITRSGETRLSWSAFALRPAWAVIPVTLPRKRHNIRYVGG